ncbi:hypothetical protein [Dyella sp.]|jgi:CheY-like chemotaxis protein|uniref:hypothetical protein n=1 Tax=Dyella sp. TaxID=1869338 RepID=UPI002D78BB6F|nr:hypothetical protein [Dyella sp.]HET6432194.1 hypothetical protein [Dyella sp.]
MPGLRRNGVAVVIEPQQDLAGALHDMLAGFGYHCVAAATHAGAARLAADFAQIHLLAACVPAPDESQAGIYLEDAAKRSPHMAVVLMLNDPLEVAPRAPAHSVRLSKPFSRESFTRALLAAEAAVGAS